MRICVNKIRYVGLLMSFLISSLVCMAFPLRSFPPLLLSPSENAFCMMFDHRGVLWIGTNNGLKSYDGYQVRTYRSDAYSPHLLPNNTVRSLAEDKDNRLINASSIRSMSTRKDSCGWAPTADCRCLTGRRSDSTPIRIRTHGSSHQRGKG